MKKAVYFDIKSRSMEHPFDIQGSQNAKTIESGFMEICESNENKSEKTCNCLPDFCNCCTSCASKFTDEIKRLIASVKNSLLPLKDNKWVHRLLALVAIAILVTESVYKIYRDPGNIFFWRRDHYE